MFEKRIWDYTAVSTFLSCRKEFYFRMVKHLESKAISAPLLYGIAVHDALDILYTSGLENALKVFSENYEDIEGDELRTKDSGKRLIETYAKVYANEPFEVLGKPEAGFVFPIGDIMWGGRIDLPVRWGKEIWIVEHKTTSRLNSNFFKQFDLDMQITSYILAIEEFLGEECMGCLVNALEPWKLLKRPTAKSKQPEDHYARSPVTRTKRLKDLFKINVQRHIRDINWCADNNEWAECHKRDVCFRYNSHCPYRTLCMFGEDERIINRDFNISPWEPYKQKEETNAETDNQSNRENKGGSENSTENPDIKA